MDLKFWFQMAKKKPMHIIMYENVHKGNVTWILIVTNTKSCDTKALFSSISPSQTTSINTKIHMALSCKKQPAYGTIISHFSQPFPNHNNTGTDTSFICHCHVRDISQLFNNLIQQTTDASALPSWCDFSRCLLNYAKHVRLESLSVCKQTGFF